MSDCTVIIPTRDRPHLVVEAVDSALAQTAAGVRVVVVDDASREPVVLPADPRLSVVRHLRPRGVSAARNLGLALATTSLVTFLDDDDRLRPAMVERSVAALAAADAPPPVGVLSAVAVTDPAGRELDVRRPPRSRPRGAHFSLEPIEPGRSYFSKQTLVVPREVLLGIRGFDEAFASRVVTELFWRLNPVCSLVGFDEVTYELRSHEGPRISTDRRLRRRSFRQLRARHRALLEAHPRGYAELLAQHARTSLADRLPLEAVAAVAAMARVAPRETAAAVRRTITGEGPPAPPPEAAGCAASTSTSTPPAVTR